MHEHDTEIRIGKYSGGELRALLKPKFEFDPWERSARCAAYFTPDGMQLGLKGQFKEEDKVLEFEGHDSSEFIADWIYRETQATKIKASFLQDTINEFYADPEKRLRLWREAYPDAESMILYVHPASCAYEANASGEPPLPGYVPYLTIPLHGPLPDKPAPLVFNEYSKEDILAAVTSFKQEIAEHEMGLVLKYQKHTERGLKHLMSSVSRYPFAMQAIALHGELTFTEWASDRPHTRYNQETGEYYASTTPGRYSPADKGMSYRVGLEGLRLHEISDHEFGHYLDEVIGQALGLKKISASPAWKKAVEDYRAQGKESSAITKLSIINTQYHPDDVPEELFVETVRRYIEVYDEHLMQAPIKHQMQAELGPLWESFERDILPLVEAYGMSLEKKQTRSNESPKNQGESGQGDQGTKTVPSKVSRLHYHGAASRVPLQQQTGKGGSWIIP